MEIDFIGTEHRIQSSITTIRDDSLSSNRQKRGEAKQTLHRSAKKLLRYILSFDNGLSHELSFLQNLYNNFGHEEKKLFGNCAHSTEIYEGFLILTVEV